MNTPVPPPRNDDELTPEERELAALYRQLPQAEPDRTLDDEILAQAARAVHGTRGSHRRGPPRWVFGAGTAAVLVLAAGLAWRLHQPGAPGANRQSAPTPMAGATTHTAKPTTAARPAFAPTVAPLPALPSPPPPPQTHATVQSPRGMLRAKVTRSNAMPAPPPTPPSPPPFAPPSPPPPPVSEPTAPRITPPPASPAPPPVHEQPTPRIAPPPAPPPPVQEMSSNAVARPPSQGELKAAAAATAGLPAHATSGALSAMTPKAEIRRIRDLLRTDHRQKAVTALREFVRAHPDYPLPADLKALLRNGH